MLETVLDESVTTDEHGIGGEGGGGWGGDTGRVY
jgi:hypothetical protein